MHCILDGHLETVWPVVLSAFIACFDLLLQELVKRRRREVVVLGVLTHVEVVAQLAFLSFIVHKVFDRIGHVLWGDS